MVVMKFGGTSVEDAVAIRRVCEIVRARAARRPLVVVSACAGVTDALHRLARACVGGERRASETLVESLRARHVRIAEELLTEAARGRAVESVHKLFRELENYMLGVSLLRELTGRSSDAFASFGERLSSILVEAALGEAGMRVRLVDATEVLVTDSRFTAAQPLMDKVEMLAKQKIMPALLNGEIVVTQGFIGRTEDGSTTTIGRGGSDLSASILGSALGAEEIQIWTDVDGMMTCDPRIVPQAKLIGSMTFNEASELAYFGAKVLHPRTILPAVDRGVPVRVLNSKRPEVAGTTIVPKAVPDVKRGPDAAGESPVIKSIAFKKGITVINVSSSRMLMAHGFLSRLFSTFADHGKSVDVVTTSEVSVSLTVDSEEGLDVILRDLREIGEVAVHGRKAIVCVVGEGMRHTSGLAGRIFTTIGKAGVNVEMVSEGASEINLTLVVDERDVEKSVRCLHDEFFG
jgi:aspartate kinase